VTDAPLDVSPAALDRLTPAALLAWAREDDERAREELGGSFLERLASDWYLADADDCRDCGEAIAAAVPGPICRRCARARRRRGAA
jgi:hypothetical protein